MTCLYIITEQMSVLTYNTRLEFKSQEDKYNLLRLLELHCFAFNECSKIAFKLKKNSLVELHRKFYRKFRRKHKNITSQVVIRAEHECLAAYRSIKSNKQKITHSCVKKRLSMRLDTHLYSWKDGKFKFTSAEKRVTATPYLYPKLSEMLKNHEFYDPLIFERDGDIWVSMSFKVENKPINQSLALGVDLGVRQFAATSEGKIFSDPKFLGEKRRLRHLKRKLQSKGTKSAKRHLKKLRRKEHNKNRNFVHHLANAILKTNADVIVLEDLSKLKQKKHKHQNKNKISQVPFYLLKLTLTYKAPLYNKKVVTVNAAYTSQTDCRTNKREGERRGRRFYCVDGIILDADVNAAINIGTRSKLPVSQSSGLLSGQAVVNRPIVPDGRNKLTSFSGEY